MPLLSDLDGTLVDSEPWHKRSEIETFRKWGLELTVADLVPFTGTTLPHMLAGIRAKHGLNIPQEEFMREQMPTFSKYIAEHVELFPDAERLVERILTEREASSRSASTAEAETRHAIVTSAMPWYVEAVLTRHPILKEAFPVIVTQGDVENSKPHPEAFLTAARQLGTRPEDCTAVEDSVNGVRSAKAAGCRVVAIDREGRGSLWEADEVVPSLDQLTW